jgi:hypothetical protein
MHDEKFIVPDIDNNQTHPSGSDAWSSFRSVRASAMAASSNFIRGFKVYQYISMLYDLRFSRR